MKIIPSQELRKLIADGYIGSVAPIAEEQIQPASLDLRLGAEAIRVRASFLPRSASIDDRLASLEMYRLDLSSPHGAVLEPGTVFLIRLAESLHLPQGCSGRANAKSSTGRLDIFARVIVEGAEQYDEIPEQYFGGIWLELAPRSFAIRVRQGSRLAQLRLRQEDVGHSGDSTHHQPKEDRRPVTVDVVGAANSGIVAYRARANVGVIDVDAHARYDPFAFWEPIHAEPHAGLILAPDRFHLLSTEQTISIAPSQVAEMCAYDIRLGELRVHYAGFFDPGFGYTDQGGLTARAVLEVRPHDVPFLIEKDQTIGHLIYEDMFAPPDKLYGHGIGSHYHGQGLRLPKQFRVG